MANGGGSVDNADSAIHVQTLTPSVALFFWVLPISFSISMICNMTQGTDGREARA